MKIKINEYCKCGAGMEVELESASGAQADKIKAIFWSQHKSPECGSCDKETARKVFEAKEKAGMVE